MRLLRALGFEDVATGSVAIVVAHPDDEVIGIGGHLPDMTGARVIHVTDGAPLAMADAHAAGCSSRSDYARLRRREAEAALAIAGIAPDHLLGFGVIDQQASMQLALVAFRLADLLTALRTRIVFTHAYEGGHPDHDATAFAAHAACRLIARASRWPPTIVEMAGYHDSPSGLVTGRFLPAPDAGSTVECTLGRPRRESKRRMLACHASQSATLAAFGVEVERFRRAPAYDFRAPPHPGPLWYDRFRWGGMTGERWRRLADAAAREIDARPVARRASTHPGGGVHRMTVINVAYPFALVGPDADGGAEQVVTRLDEALASAGHRSIVVARAGSHTTGELRQVTATTGPIDDGARARVHAHCRRLLVDILARERVDLVHMHGIDFHRYLPAPGPKVMVTVHLPPAWYPDEALRPTRPSTWLHGVSATQHRSFPTGVALLPPIENGVPVERLAARHARRGFVLCLGRICPEKGIHLGIDACKEAGRTLLIAGSVYDYAAHQRYFRDEIVPRLDRRRRFLGPVGFARKRRLLSAAHCLLVPSLAPETSSLVAMEALACGTPVVAFPAGALTEIVEHGRTGFLVSGVHEMSEAVERASSLDGETCRAEARRRFSLDRMIGRYLQRYRALAKLAA